MNNQDQLPVQNNYKFFKTLAIGFTIVSFIIAIGVGGYILGTRNNQSLQDRVNEQNPVIFPTQGTVDGNKPLPSTLPNKSDETANWKTYNFSYLSIKLPEGWKAQNEGNPIQLINYDIASAAGRDFNPDLDKGKLKIEVYKTEFGDNIRRYLDGVKAERYQKGLGDARWEEKKITVDGLPGIWVKTSSSGFVVYTQASNSEKIISIAFALDFDNYQNIANQILSTFRFIQ